MRREFTFPRESLSAKLTSRRLSLKQNKREREDYFSPWEQRSYLVETTELMKIIPTPIDHLTIDLKFPNPFFKNSPVIFFLYSFFYSV